MSIATSPLLDAGERCKHAQYFSALLAVSSLAEGSQLVEAGYEGISVVKH